MTGAFLTDRLPTPGAGFLWEPFDEALVLRPDTEEVRAAFTTRVGGVSDGSFASWNVSFAVGDDRERVVHNRELAGRTIGRPGARSWGRIRQVHGTRVVRADDEAELREADAVWTDDGSDLIAVFGADCVPVLLVGPAAVGAVHAGWRGLEGGVVEAAADAMDATKAWIGPGIGPCCFAVDADRADRLRRRFGDEVVPDPQHADLWRAAEIAAERAGIGRVRTARVCTSCHEDLFFSHRRDVVRLGRATGRQALVATPS